MAGPHIELSMPANVRNSTSIITWRRYAWRNFNGVRKFFFASGKVVLRNRCFLRKNLSQGKRIFTHDPGHLQNRFPFQSNFSRNFKPLQNSFRNCAIGTAFATTYANMETESLKIKEKELILKVLAKTGWNLEKASRLLRITLSLLKRKIREQGIEKPDSQ